MRDCPLNEAAIVGFCVGLGIAGRPAIAKLESMDFAAFAMDPIVNQAAKIRYYWGGQVQTPLVVRMPVASQMGFGTQHSQSLEASFMHAPGLKLAMPATGHDAKGLIKTAIREPNPVVFVENISLYATKSRIPDEEYLIPFGKAEIKRADDDVTVVALAAMVPPALQAAEELAQTGLSIEVIDPRTLAPSTFRPSWLRLRKRGDWSSPTRPTRPEESGLKSPNRLSSEPLIISTPPLCGSRQQIYPLPPVRPSKQPCIPMCVTSSRLVHPSGGDEGLHDEAVLSLMSFLGWSREIPRWQQGKLPWLDKIYLEILCANHQWGDSKESGISPLERPLLYVVRRNLIRVTARALWLRTARYCWSFSLRLDYERGHCCALDTRGLQLPSAAGRGVSTPAARAECGVSSGAAKFGDVVGAAARG